MLAGVFKVDRGAVESAFVGLRVVEKIENDRKYSIEE